MTMEDVIKIGSLEFLRDRSLDYVDADVVRYSCSALGNTHIVIVGRLLGFDRAWSATVWTNRGKVYQLDNGASSPGSAFDQLTRQARLSLHIEKRAVEDDIGCFERLSDIAKEEP